MTSPFSFQIKEKSIEDLSDGTKQKVRKKYERMQLVEKFAEAIAPEQSDELISQVLHSEDEDVEEESVPEDLIVLLKMFKEIDALGQILLLAVINHSKYSKEPSIRIFGCKKHQIDQSHKRQKEKSGLSIQEKKKIHWC